MTSNMKLLPRILPHKQEAKYEETKKRLQQHFVDQKELIIFHTKHKFIYVTMKTELNVVNKTSNIFKDGDRLTANSQSRHLPQYQGNLEVIW